MTVSPGAPAPAASRVDPALSESDVRDAGTDLVDLSGENARRPLTLVAESCCVCGDQGAEPVAVVEDFDYRTSPDSFLTLRCSGCGSVYLNPAPAEHERERIYPLEYLAAAADQPTRPTRRARQRPMIGELARWRGTLDPEARILDVGCGSGIYLRILRGMGARGWRLEGVEPTPAAVEVARGAGFEIHAGKLEELDLANGAYDLALLIHTLEHASDPSATLAALSRLLRPGGHAVVVVHNVASPSFRWFRGRHWGGYDVPRQRRLLSADALGQLARRAGLTLVSLSTLPSGELWVRSVRRLLQDWGAPAWLRHRFGEDSLVAPLGFGALEAVYRRGGKGGLVVAVLRRPEVPE